MRSSIKRISSLLLALILSLMLCTPVLAAGSTISIATAEELTAFARKCSSDAYSKSLTVHLISDIDLSGAAVSIPIFLGTFDGGGHRITGLSLTDAASRYGLFSRVTAEATVRNLFVSGSVTPSGTQERVGGIAGENYGTIEKCTFSGAVTGSSAIGGIAGYNGSGGTISGCSVSGTVHGTTSTGGITGQNYGAVCGSTNGASVNTDVIESEITEGDLENTLYALLKDQQAPETGTNTDTGGIAGYSTGTIDSCTNTGGVGYPHVGYNVGGIVGRQDGLVSASVNRGSVQGRKDVGGIVGQMIPDITIQAGPDRVAQLRDQLTALSDLTQRTANDLSDTGDMVTDRVTRINQYAGSAETTVKELLDGLSGDMTPDELQAWLDKVSDSSDAIHGDLTGISNEMSSLTTGLSNANKTLAADLRAVNSQFSTTMQLFMTLIDEVTDSSTELTQDISEDTLYSAKRGKAVDCTNHGTVQGDRNVGGVTGAMAIEYDYDREDDLLPTGSRTVKYSYLTRAILLDCHNYGTVTAKKSCAGSVAGRMDLGIISGCGGWGDTAAESGDYVGGIAGLSLTAVQRSYAKCTLSGGKYVGGIVGSGCRLSDCIAMPCISSASQLSGAVAGEITGSYSGNLFVSDTLAGVDRISYEGKAAPITYDDLLSRSDIPSDFRRLTLTFQANGSTLKKVVFDYGASFDDSVYPTAPAKDGCYVRWDVTSLRDLRFDTVVTAVYEPYITTLSWATASDGRAALLVEGQFREGDRLRAAACEAPAERSDHLLAAYSVAIPADTAGTHTVRWYLPDDAPSRLQVYTDTGSGWQQVSCETAGSYLRFDMSGSGRFAVSEDTSLPVRVWIIVGCAAALALVALLGIRLHRKKHQKA